MEDFQSEHCCVCNIDAPLKTPEDAFRIVYCKEHDPQKEKKPKGRCAGECLICGDNAYYKYPWRPLREKGDYCINHKPDFAIRFSLPMYCSCSDFAVLMTHGKPKNSKGHYRTTPEMCLYCAIDMRKYDNSYEIVDMREYLTNLYNKKYKTNHSLVPN